MYAAASGMSSARTAAALSEAATGGWLGEAMSFLLERGATLDLVDLDGVTPAFK